LGTGVAVEIALGRPRVAVEIVLGRPAAASVALPPVLEHPDVFHGAPRRRCAVRTCFSVGV